MFDQFIDKPISFEPNTLFLLLILVLLEAVLSADNAVALAAIAQGLPSAEAQRKVLNVGLILAYILRVGLILTATWVVQFWQFELLGASYLLWLVFNYFNSKEDEENPHHALGNKSFWQTIPLIAFTDLAFSPIEAAPSAAALAPAPSAASASGSINDTLLPHIHIAFRAVKDIR